MARKAVFWVFVFCVFHTAVAVSNEEFEVVIKPFAGVSECRLMYRDSVGEITPLFLDDHGRIIKDPTERYAGFIIPDVDPFIKTKFHMVTIAGSTRKILYEDLKNITFLFHDQNRKKLHCELEKMGSGYFLRAVDYNFAFRISNVLEIKGYNPDERTQLIRNLQKSQHLEVKGVRQGAVVCKLKGFYAVGALYFHMKTAGIDPNDFLPVGYKIAAFKGSRILIKKENLYSVHSNTTIDLLGVKLRQGKNVVTSGQFRNILVNLVENPRKNSILEPYAMVLTRGTAVTPEEIHLEFAPMTIMIHLANGGVSDLFQKENLSFFNTGFQYDPRSLSWNLKGPLKKPVEIGDLKKVFVYHDLKRLDAKNHTISFQAIPRQTATFDVKINFLLKRLNETASNVGLPSGEALFLKGARINHNPGAEILLRGVDLPSRNIDDFFRHIQVSEKSRYHIHLSRVAPEGNRVTVDYLRKDKMDKVLIVYYPVDIATSYRTLLSEQQLMELAQLDMELRNFLLKVKKSQQYNKVFVRFGGGEIRRINDRDSLLNEFTGIQSISAHLFMGPDMLKNIGDTYLWSDNFIRNDYRFISDKTSSFYHMVYFGSFSTPISIDRFLRQFKDVKLYLVNIVSRDFEFVTQRDHLHVQKQLVKNLSGSESFKNLLNYTSILDFFNKGE